MQEPKKWREILGIVISNPKEKYRLADVLGVQPFTLMHWYYGESSPSPIDLGQLLQALPEHQTVLTPLIVDMLEYMATDGLEESEVIPPEFYEQISRARMSIPASIRPWSLCSLILQQALSQLDSDKQGMSLCIVRCMLPRENGKIRSLREMTGRGTPPWPQEIGAQVLLGKTSLAGEALLSRRTLVVNLPNTAQGVSAVYRKASIVSVAFCPIIQDGAVAGCLQAQSTQANYFTPSHLTLLERYTELLTFIFEPDDFYDVRQIELEYMPPFDVQLRHLPSYRQRVAGVLRDAMRRGELIDIAHAEQTVWQQLEEEFLQLMR